MFQSNITLYITIFFFSIIGCKRGCQRLSEAPKHASVAKQASMEPAVFVLFHGLGSEASCFKHLAAQLKQAFPDASVVALKSVEREQTALLSITEQANESWKELITSVSDLESRPIILIGHSQGGLRAYKMFERYKEEYGDTLPNPIGIVTIATPWEGADVLNKVQELAPPFFEAPVLDDMRKFSTSLGQDSDWAEKYFESTLEKYQVAAFSDGCKDLTPGSDFLGWVKNTLPNAKIPILAIGGEQSDFRIFLPQKSKDNFKALRKAWTELITGKTHHSNKKEKKHDMVVRLSSQLAWNIPLDRNSNFTEVSIPDALHDEILPLPPISQSKNILVHPVMIQEVIAFSNQVLYGTSNQATNKRKRAEEIGDKPLKQKDSAGCMIMHPDWEPTSYIPIVQPKPGVRIVPESEYVLY
ncbi:alpha/beta hydrolase [Cardinium endosymbiont of Philonthus spinipes]|uniref:alpha/beta hydrolase n=1 Tax=Cardinium endosymbiont of Philonthus spinipes TaxID=3077941 RepID=UPI00313E85D1